MAFLDAYNSQPTPIVEEMLRAVHLVTPRLLRIDLQEPSATNEQTCTFVRLQDGTSTKGTLLLRVFHEGQRVITIEVVTSE